MQLYQVYLLSVGERYFLLRGQLKVNQQLYGSICIRHSTIIKFLLESINLKEINAKEVVFVDDFSVADSLDSIKDYWDKLTAIGPKYGYFPKSTKSYLRVKKNKLMEVQKLFANSRVNITAEGKRLLGAVIGTTEYREMNI